MAIKNAEVQSTEEKPNRDKETILQEFEDALVEVGLATGIVEPTDSEAAILKDFEKTAEDLIREALMLGVTMHQLDVTAKLAYRRISDAIRAGT